MAITLVRRHTSLGYGKTEYEREKTAFFITCICMIGLVVVIFRNRGFFTCFAVVVYLAALSSMSLVLKNVFVDQDFDFPLWITSWHFFCTFVCASVILARRASITRAPMIRLQTDTFIRGVVPMALCFSLSTGLSNEGLSFSNVHFYEMVDTAAPLVTALITVLMGTPFDKRLLWPLGLVTAALVCCWSGEAQFSWIAFAFLLVGTILRALKGVLNQLYLTEFAASPTQVLDPVELVMYTSLISFGIMASWSLALDGTEPFQQIWRQQALFPSSRIAFAMSAVVATIINFAGIFIIRDMGAIVQQLTGNLKGGLSVLGSVAVRGEVISIRQAFGFGVLICGIAWYNSLDMKLKNESSVLSALQPNRQNENAKASDKLIKRVKS